MMTRGAFLAAVALALSGLCNPASSQEAFPSRPLKIVVGFAAGGSSDTVARLLAEKLAVRFGKPVIVENRPGAGGMVATSQLLREPADGYQVLLLASAHSVTAALRTSMPFDPVDDIEWLSTAATYGMAFGVRPDSPYGSLAEIVAAAKARPRTLSYYSVGYGTGHHLLGEWLNAATGAEFTHVPYRGSAAAISDFLGGRVDLMIDTMTFVHPHAAAGKVRTLAVTSRLVPPEMAAVPFSGDVVPGLAYESWLGLAIRKGAPAAIVERWRAEITAVVQSDAFAQDMSRLGANAAASTGPVFAERVRREIAEFSRVIEARGIERQQ
ncbi:tripartite-type tricarboxylate transporter receptor subunit TctC [Bosea sp. OAE752]|uniref:Bug family tripartite tricarboxylate transporter substrate binding protein n=1 Tax=Bosea sp. OAE752 TaxID=2663873 RepID=UPI003D1CB2DB